MAESKGFNKILAPIDGSDLSMKAAKKALILGKNLDIKVLPLYVINVNMATGVLPPDQVYTIWKKAIEDEAKKSLKKVADMANNLGVDVETMMVEGEPDEEIIKEAKKDDLIVMGSKGKSAVDRIFIGSVSEKVLHHTKANVLIVR